MATWKKVIVSGSDAELNNLSVLKASGSFSGSFQGEVLGTMASSSVSTLSQTASVALRANALAPTVTATSASVAARATTLSSAATASFADISTLSRGGSGSFSGSYQGDGSNLTGLATTLTVDGDSGTQDVSLTADDLQILGTTNEIVTAITKVGTDVKATISLPDDVTIGNDITITRDALISRNLTVRGTASFEATADLNIADRFIGLASGSAATGDGGINIQQGANGRGEGFGFENSVSRWGVTSSFDPLGNTITPDAFMTVNVSDGSANDPTAIAARYQKNGNIFIGNTGDIWIYS